MPVEYWDEVFWAENDVLMAELHLVTLLDSVASEVRWIIVWCGIYYTQMKHYRTALKYTAPRKDTTSLCL